MQTPDTNLANIKSLSFGLVNTDFNPANYFITSYNSAVERNPTSGVVPTCIGKSTNNILFYGDPISNYYVIKTQVVKQQSKA